MSTREVRTQKEFDQAVADGVKWIDIKSGRGVWIDATACGSSTATATASSGTDQQSSRSVRFA